jgi:hypothetical protein
MTEADRFREQAKQAREHAEPACFLVPMHRQEDVIGDLDERFNQRWLTTLGPNGAKWCYIWNLVRASLAVRAAVFGMVGSLIWKALRGG